MPILNKNKNRIINFNDIKLEYGVPALKANKVCKKGEIYIQNKIINIRCDICDREGKKIYKELIIQYNTNNKILCKHCLSSITKKNNPTILINAAKKRVDTIQLKGSFKNHKEKLKITHIKKHGGNVSKYSNSEKKKQTELNKQRICKNCNKIFNNINRSIISYTYCNDCCSNIKFKCSCGCGADINFINYIQKGVRYKEGHNNKGKFKLSPIEIKDTILSKLPNFELLTDIKNIHSVVTCKCNKCNNIWQQRVSSLYYNQTFCTKCKTTTTEQHIAQILNEYNIDYKFQHSFQDCKDKRPLPFDFYIPDFNLCIEYDGEGHYKDIKHWGGVEGLQQRQRRDYIKTQFCKDNNINLLRIPYWSKENIEDSLKSLIMFEKILKFYPEKVNDYLEKLNIIVTNYYNEVNNKANDLIK